jgi:8-amino-7-oxononanoate synthase
VRLSGATMKRFRHNDAEQLDGIVAGLPAEAGKGIVIDGVYSMGGDTAPLDVMVEICRRHPNTFLLDDEAHGLGVLGALGRGAAEQYGVLDDVDLLTVTFSKTLGSCGGALIGPQAAIELLTLDSDPLIFTASNTPASVAAALAALRILRAEPERPQRLRDNVATFLRLLDERGVPANPVESAIVTIPLRRPDDVSTVIVFKELMELGVFVNPVIPPASGGDAGLIRLSLMADHTAAMLEETAEALLKVFTDQEQLPPDADDPSA